MNVPSTTEARIQEFLTAKTFAVAGSSRDRGKYGNKVLRAYQQNGRPVVPVHPRETEIEGVRCVATIQDLPPEAQSLSIITPPAVTEQIVAAAIAKGIRNVWMQPGAESPAAVDLALSHGLNVIADGTCLLVVLHYHE